MVRFKNITLGSFRVVVTLIISSFYFQATAQNTPPIPTVCSGTPPVAGELFGGDFDVLTSSGTLTNGSYCLKPSETSVDLSFVQNNSAVIGSFFPASVSYIENVDNNSDLVNGYKSQNTFNFGEGYFWVAQTGINSNNDTYHTCKLISVFKRQPVTASIETCSSSTVTVTIPPISEIPTNNHTRYRVDWGDGFNQTINVTSNTTPIIFTKNFVPTNSIVVTGEYANENGVFVCDGSATFSGLPTSANNIYINRLEKKANGSDYEIEFKGFAQNVEYLVSYAEDDGTNTYSWVDAPGKFVNGNATINNLDPTKNYCFKIAYVNNCGISSIAKESNVVCSITLNSEVLSSTDVKLNWNRPTNPIGILQQNDLQKDEQGCPSGCYAEPSLSSFTATEHVYKSLACGKIFTFRVYNRFTIRVSGTARDVEIISNLVEIDPANTILTTKPKFPAVVGYTDDASEIFFNVNTDETKDKWNFYRSVGGNSPYTLVGSSPNNIFTDNNVGSSQESYCYKYSYFDDCGNESAQSDAYCTVFLSSDAPRQLNWTNYEVPNADASDDPIYTIEYIDANGNFNPISNTLDLQSDSNIADFISSITDPSISFRIVAALSTTLPDGSTLLFTSKSNIFTFNLPAAAFIPTAFTPNNDGINDIFKPELRFINSGIMIIYDRWGSIIFETTNLNEGWDGTEVSGSRLAPVGTYAYKIQTLNDQGNTTFYNGSVTLIR